MHFLDACADATWGLAIRIERSLPPAATERLARVVARAAFGLNVPARRHLESNLHRLLAGPAAPGKVRALALESFEQFALMFADMLRLDRLNPEVLARSCVVTGAEHLDAARASGRGVVVLSSHAGNWEWGAAWLSASGFPVRVLARRHRGAVERCFERRRACHHVRRLEGDVLWRVGADALRRGEWIAVMGDRALPGTRRSLSSWGFAVARRGGGLLLPAVMSRIDRGRYRVTFDAPLEPRAPQRARLGESVLAHVRRAPEQWFGFEPLPESAA